MESREAFSCKANNQLLRLSRLPWGDAVVLVRGQCIWAQRSGNWLTMNTEVIGYSGFSVHKLNYIAQPVSLIKANCVNSAEVSL